MTDPVRRCPDHGFVAGVCPDCGAVGETVLSADRRTRLSKFLSGALRHFPDDAGLSLDDHGWAAWPDLVAAASERYPWADADAVPGVVTADPKGRFERTEGRVRAAYGHSVDVSLESAGRPVPDELYHGTAPENVDAIHEAGLKPMGRQQVHLAGTRPAARAVGRRHAPAPVVFAVDAASLTDEYRITKRGAETYTVDRVPPGYLTLVDG
ncbi:RNA 2'-phosphotransferase [Haloplanus litoreus]|uniref:Probable RNA 2'-phosphotransferase n=1 Tax=Haloplanus litoreus TaxID=767515 RepID=A0ABD5ZYR9_9EURY